MSGTGIGAVVGFLLGGPVGALAGAALGASADKKRESTELRLADIAARAEAAIRSEEQSGSLAALLRKHLSEDDVREAIPFLKHYVRMMPALLESMHTSAEAVRTEHPQVKARIDAVLHTAQEYIFEEHDFIPDSIGLLGMLDDAYLTIRLITCVANEIVTDQSQSFLPPDLETRNKVVAGMIGATVVSKIETKIKQTLDMPSSRVVLGDLLQMAGPFMAVLARQQQASRMLSGPGPTTSAVNHMAAMNGFDYQVR